MRPRAAGGLRGEFRLALRYRLRKNAQEVFSNNLAYGKTWPDVDAITEDDALAFRQWVERGMAPACACGSTPRGASFQAATRSSARLDELESRHLTPVRLFTREGDAAAAATAAAATAAAAEEAAAEAAAASTAAAYERYGLGI